MKIIVTSRFSNESNFAISTITKPFVNLDHWSDYNTDARKLINQLNMRMILLFVLGVASQDLVPHIFNMGAALCHFLVARNQIPKHSLNSCSSPTCNWDDWLDALNFTEPFRKRVVLSYSHNGFGKYVIIQTKLR